MKILLVSFVLAGALPGTGFAKQCPQHEDMIIPASIPVSAEAANVEKESLRKKEVGLAFAMIFAAGVIGIKTTGSENDAANSALKKDSNLSKRNADKV